MESFGAVLLHPINVPTITVCVFTGGFSQQGDRVFWAIANIRKTFEITKKSYQYLCCQKIKIMNSVRAWAKKDMKEIT